MKDLFRYYIDMDFDWILAGLIFCGIVSAVLGIALCLAAKRGDEKSAIAMKKHIENE